MVPQDFEAFLDRIDAGLTDPSRKSEFDAWVMAVEGQTGLDASRVKRLRRDLITVIAATHRLAEPESTRLVDAWLGVPTPAPKPTPPRRPVVSFD